MVNSDYETAQEMIVNYKVQKATQKQNIYDIISNYYDKMIFSRESLTFQIFYRLSLRLKILNINIMICIVLFLKLEMIKEL